MNSLAFRWTLESETGEPLLTVTIGTIADGRRFLELHDRVKNAPHPWVKIKAGRCPKRRARLKHDGEGYRQHRPDCRFLDRALERYDDWLLARDWRPWLMIGEEPHTADYEWYDDELAAAVREWLGGLRCKTYIRRRK